jgi:hypothetical protein
MTMATSWRAGVFIFSAMIASGRLARADITLLLEEPYGTFGGMNPTGHSAVYFSGVCAETPVTLRRCHPGETGAVISRYHRVGGYDWLAIPLIPYLYAVDTADEVPDSATPEEVASLRDGYRRAHLEEIVPDLSDGAAPQGDWTQLVGEAYDRTMYGFKLETSQQQDDELIEMLNSRPNQVQFHLLYNNCADFVRQVIDFYYPRAVHRSFTADVGIMTPKQAAKSLVHYSNKHAELIFSGFVIAQVPGTVPRSSRVRGVMESLLKSKRYAVPLASLAVLHPAVGGTLAYALVEGSHFDPRKTVALDGGLPVKPEALANELKSSSGSVSLQPTRSLQ